MADAIQAKRKVMIRGKQNALTGLTPRQAVIVDYICDFMYAYQYPPTLREMMAAFDIGSINGISAHLKALEKKGIIRRMHDRKGLSRTIVMLKGPCPFCRGDKDVSHRQREVES